MKRPDSPQNIDAVANSDSEDEETKNDWQESSENGEVMSESGEVRPPAMMIPPSSESWTMWIAKSNLPSAPRN